MKISIDSLSYDELVELNHTHYYPKATYIDWANSFDDDGPKIEKDSKHSLSILFSDEYDARTSPFQ